MRYEELYSKDFRPTKLHNVGSIKFIVMSLPAPAAMSMTLNISTETSITSDILNTNMEIDSQHCLADTEMSDICQYIYVHPAEPEKFDGDPARCWGFLLQGQIYLISHGNVSDQSSLLPGKALTWATAVWEKGGESVSSYKCFVSLFCRVFDHAPEGKEVGERHVELWNMPWSSEFWQPRAAGTSPH